jgi:hypothetical protein
MEVVFFIDFSLHCRIICRAWFSIDHLVRPRQHIRRYRQTDLLGGLQIDDDWDSAA